MRIPLDRKQILGGSARRFSPKTQLHFGYGAMPGVENTNPPGRAFPGPHATKGRKRDGCLLWVSDGADSSREFFTVRSNRRNNDGSLAAISSPSRAVECEQWRRLRCPVNQLPICRRR